MHAAETLEIDTPFFLFSGVCLHTINPILVVNESINRELSMPRTPRDNYHLLSIEQSIVLVNESIIRELSMPRTSRDNYHLLSIEQPVVLVNESIIRELSMPRTPRDNYHLLSIEQPIVLVRLCTGHTRLNDRTYRKLKPVPSPACPCGQEGQTAEHNYTPEMFPSTGDKIRWEADRHSTNKQPKLHGCKKGAGEDTDPPLKQTFT